MNIREEWVATGGSAQTKPRGWFYRMRETCGIQGWSHQGWEKHEWEEGGQICRRAGTWAGFPGCRNLRLEGKWGNGVTPGEDVRHFHSDKFYFQSRVTRGNFLGVGETWELHWWPEEHLEKPRAVIKCTSSKEKASHPIERSWGHWKEFLVLSWLMGRALN